MNNYSVKVTPSLSLTYKGKVYNLVSASLSSSIGGYVFTAGLLPSHKGVEVVYGEHGTLNISGYRIKGLLVHSAPLANEGAYTTQLVFKDPFSIRHSSYLFTTPIQGKTLDGDLSKLKKAGVHIAAMNSGSFSGLIQKYSSIKEELFSGKAAGEKEKENQAASIISKATSGANAKTAGYIINPILQAIKTVGKVDGIYVPTVQFASGLDYVTLLAKFWIQMLKTDQGIINIGTLLDDWMGILGLVMIVNPWNGRAHILPQDFFPKPIPQNKVMSNISSVSYDMYGSDYPYTASIARFPGTGLGYFGESSIYTISNKSTKIGKITEFGLDINSIISMSNLSPIDSINANKITTLSKTMESAGINMLLKQSLASHTIRVQSEIPYYGMIVGHGSKITVGGDFEGMLASYRMDFNPGSIQTSMEVGFTHQSSMKMVKPVISGLFTTASVESAYRNSISKGKDQGEVLESNQNSSYKSEGGK